MVVMAREDWTDARVDDFKETVNQRFDQVDKRFDQVNQRFEQVDKRFDRVEDDIRGLRTETKKGFERIDDKFESMHRTMVIGFVTLFASIAASVIGALVLG